MKRLSLVIMALLALFGALTPVRAGDSTTELLVGDAAAQFGWKFDNGREFPGATGKVAVDSTTRCNGKDSLKLDGDFTKGGNYVRAFTMLDGIDIRALTLWVMNPDLDGMSLRIIDASGQCHQFSLKIVAKPDWQKIEFPLQQFFAKAEGITGAQVNRYESWGGAKDQKWHGPAKEIDVLIAPAREKKAVSMWIGGVTILPPPSALVSSSAFREGFETGDALPEGWTKQGGVTVDTTQAFKGKNSLVLARTPEASNEACSVTSPNFKIKPGMLALSVACKSDLKSPDNSFNGVVTLEYLSGASVLESATVADIFGIHSWQALAKELQPPAGADSARLRVQINKASGKFWVDEVAAAFLVAAAPKDNRIERMYFSNPRIGHFLYPGDAPEFKVTVEATKPLSPEQLQAKCTLRDYWGAEQGAPVEVPLTQVPGLRNGRTAYEGTVDFSKNAIEVGRYYEIHGEVPRANDEAYRNYSSFVVEPEAVANSYKASEIPFSGRNWDGRIPATFDISHRIGIRVMNLWSGWSATAPYTPHAPCVEICKKYEMGAIFGVPTGAIERREGDWKAYDEQALREGTRNLIQTYRKMVEPFIISLGNEPPVNKDWIPANVEAYRIIYDEAKKTDPSVIVVGTSIGATEEFFKGGFGKYCDAYDFHCYEDPQNVFQVFGSYQGLFKKYGNPQPIWSTELGLNSQGMARSVVAIDMVKKFALFFAGGGVNMSWFDLFYPDGDAKIAGSSSEAHNVIDARYLQYAPKLTAVTYYDLVNSIAIKKFVQQKQYAQDVHACLMRDRDNRQLQILWKDKGRLDAFIPLPGASKVQVIRLGGAHRDLNADGKGVTLTLSEEPLLLLYEGTAALADTLGAPAATVAVPSAIVRAAVSNVTVKLAGTPAADVNLVAPPYWQVSKTSSNDEVVFAVTCPEATEVRQADLTVTLGSGDARCGELYLRPMVTGQLSAEVMPVAATEGKPPAVKLIVKNNGAKPQNVSWEMSLVSQLALTNGQYSAPQSVSDTHFAEASNGQAAIAGGATKEFIVPLAAVDAQTVYAVHATVTDSSDRVTVAERNVAAFVAVPRATGKIALDGTLDAPDWKKAPIQKIDEKRQYFSFDKNLASWKGPQDLSGTIRFLWDDKYLYVGADVTDDAFANTKEDGGIWSGDGLQFLIDHVADHLDGSRLDRGNLPRQEGRVRHDPGGG